MGSKGVILFLAAGLVASHPPLRAQPQVDLIITGGAVIDVRADAPPRLADVVIDAGRIIAVGPAAAGYQAERVLDATGRFVLPGLADMHTHFGTGARPPDVDDSAQVLARLLYFGVTTTLNLGSFQAGPSRIEELRAAMARGELSGPRLLAAGALITVPGSHPTTTIYSPPLQARIAAIVASESADAPIDLWPATARATTLVRTAAHMRAEVERLGRWGADVVKLVVESGPDGFGDDHPQMPAALIRAAADGAAAFGIPVLCHVSSVDEMDACLAHGASGFVHAGGDSDTLPADFVRRMAAARMTLIPTATLYEGWVRYPADLSLLDDPWLAPTLTAGERAWLTSEGMVKMFTAAGGEGVQKLASLRAYISTAHDAGVPIVAGTDVGNPYRFAGHSLHEELAFYVSAGLTPREALATATVNAARLVGGEDEWGSIEPGLAADLLVLDENPLEDIDNTRTLRHVIRGGVVVDRTSLPVR